MNKPKDPLLDLILQKYIQCSRDSIHGPVALKTDKKLVSLNKVAESKKIIFDIIPDESKLGSVNIDGHSVSSFVVGGEKRLCFTEIVHTVLKDANVQDIFKKRDNLLIFTSKCTQKQLDELKYHEVLPWTTTSSNLISISDAFRLIGALQYNLAPKADPMKRSSSAFEVYHECFGGCIGMIDPALYSAVNAPCIRCTECNGLFSTKKFVSHNHSNYDEVHTCHWGFDSSNWRIYIMLVEQKPTRDHIALWNSVKNKYTRNHQTQETTDNDSQDADFMAYINSPDSKKELVSPIENLRTKQAASASDTSTSAFRPWSPKVVASSSSSRFSKTHNDKFTFPNSKHCEHRDNSLISPVYMNCQQCSTASNALCGKHSRKEKNTTCSCSECKKSVEGSLEGILRNFITSPDNRLTTDPHDLAKILADELKKLSLTNDEKITQMSINNQRLQTELQLVKIESAKRLGEVRDSKANVEQELEMLHRERQKVLIVIIFCQLLFSAF